MVTSVNIHEAKTNLSRIVDEVKRLGVNSRFGFMKHIPPIPDDFDSMYADEIAETEQFYFLTADKLIIQYNKPFILQV